MDNFLDINLSKLLQWENRIHLAEGREKMDIRESQKVKLRKPAQVRTEAGGSRWNIKGRIKGA